MKTKDFEKFYFPTKEINDLRQQTFDRLKKVLGVDNFFCCKDFNPDQRVSFKEDLYIKLAKYIKSSKTLPQLFIAIYKLEIDDLSEFLFDSIVVDEAIKTKDENFNVFLDKSSVLFFDRQYPLYFKRWQKNKKQTILDECALESKFLKGVRAYFNEKQQKAEIFD